MIYGYLRVSTDKDRHAKMIKVKGVINYDDLNYIKQMPDLLYIDLSECEVVEQSLPDSLFAGRNIRYFCSPSNLTSCGKDILAGCKRIGGIKWNSKIAVPEDILGGVEYRQTSVSLSMHPNRRQCSHLLHTCCEDQDKPGTHYRRHCRCNQMWLRT